MLLLNHIINSIINLRNSSNQETHWLSLDKLMPRQYSIIKDPLVDMDNRCNKIFPSFSPFNCENSPENRLMDLFPNHFSFHTLNRKNNHDIKSYLWCLNNITIQASLDSLSVVVVIDASIKNQIATSILHIHSHDNSVIKTIYHIVNVASTEAELFTIRCSINQATCLPNVNQIFIITDSIHAAKRIFDSSLYPYQIQSHMNS